jgi:hypothetical protein
VSRCPVTASVLALLVALACATSVGATTRPWVWTKKQAEYYVSGKGNPGIVAACRGIGSPYRHGGINYYYRFGCAVGFSDGSEYYVVIKPTGPRSYRRLSVRKLRGATGGTYAGTGSGHWITSKSLDNSVVKLEDGSRWLVSPIDRYEVTTWLAVDDITVLDGSDVFYPYQLVNTDDGSSVDAKFLGYS